MFYLLVIIKKDSNKTTKINLIVYFIFKLSNLLILILFFYTYIDMIQI